MRSIPCPLRSVRSLRCAVVLLLLYGAFERVYSFCNVTMSDRWVQLDSGRVIQLGFHNVADYTAYSPHTRFFLFDLNNDAVEDYVFLEDSGAALLYIDGQFTTNVRTSFLWEQPGPIYFLGLHHMETFQAPFANAVVFDTVTGELLALSRETSSSDNFQRTLFSLLTTSAIDVTLTSVSAGYFDADSSSAPGYAYTYYGTMGGDTVMHPTGDGNSVRLGFPCAEILAVPTGLIRKTLPGIVGTAHTLTCFSSEIGGSRVVYAAAVDSVQVILTEVFNSNQNFDFSHVMLIGTELDAWSMIAFVCVYQTSTTWRLAVITPFESDNDGGQLYVFVTPEYSDRITFTATDVTLDGKPDLVYIGDGFVYLAKGGSDVYTFSASIIMGSAPSEVFNSFSSSLHAVAFPPKCTAEYCTDATMVIAISGVQWTYEHRCFGSQGDPTFFTTTSAITTLTENASTSTSSAPPKTTSPRTGSATHASASMVVSVASNWTSTGVTLSVSQGSYPNSGWSSSFPFSGADEHTSKDAGHIVDTDLDTTPIIVGVLSACIVMVVVVVVCLLFMRRRRANLSTMSTDAELHRNAPLSAISPHLRDRLHRRSRQVYRSVSRRSRTPTMHGNNAPRVASNSNRSHRGSTNVNAMGVGERQHAHNNTQQQNADEYMALTLVRKSPAFRGVMTSNDQTSTISASHSSSSRRSRAGSSGMRRTHPPQPNTTNYQHIPPHGNGGYTTTNALARRIDGSSESKHTDAYGSVHFTASDDGAMTYDTVSFSSTPASNVSPSSVYTSVQSSVQNDYDSTSTPLR